MDDHNRLHLHIPNFVYTSLPTLVHGGGAEIVPVANPDWFAHNGFSLDEFLPVDSANPAGDVHDSTSAPFDFSLPFSTDPVPAPPPPPPPPNLSLFAANALAAPSPLGLPVYSASGFDLLGILARVAHRPYPRVVLGPVDLTCSFVVVDIRRFDNPIVYCSPSFCALTGYSESEVLGRNCRFLQAPGGDVKRGDVRRFTSPDAVKHLRKALLADKECQTSIVNYKKNGAAFINLVTVIPVPGDSEDNEIIYHVGFQVDLTEQPNAILEKLRDGSYIVDYVGRNTASVDVDSKNRLLQQHQPQGGGGNVRDRKANSIPPIVMSKELKRLLADPIFLRSFPVSPPPASNSEESNNNSTSATGGSSNHLLHLFLLEASPDFIHVVSLKGSFLYVAPSVRRVLGYEAEEMVGTSLSDYAHPEDVIPLMRELKESSATGITSAANSSSEASNPASAPSTDRPQQQTQPAGMPRSVDLLFRAKTKMGRYVWVECRGRLHVEPGKGRKAIVLSGRAREMMNLQWEDVAAAGGIARGLKFKPQPQAEDKECERQLPVVVVVEQEAWGLLGGTTKDTLTFLSVGKGMFDVLGYSTDDLLGRSVLDLVRDDSAREVLGGFVDAMRRYQVYAKRNKSNRYSSSDVVDSSRVKKVRCALRKRDGSFVDVVFIIYRADADDDENQVNSDDSGSSISPASLIYQIRLLDAETIMPSSIIPKVKTLLPSFSSTSSSVSSSSLAGAVEPLPPATTSIHAHGAASSTGGCSSSSPSASPSSRFSSSSSPLSLENLHQQLTQGRHQPHAQARHHLGLVGHAQGYQSQAPSSSTSSSSSESPSKDMFEELAIARGSSWQYELQQLRFANLRLQEELAALEAAEDVIAACAGVGVDVGSDEQQQQQQQLRGEQVSTAGYATVAYDDHHHRQQQFLEQRQHEQERVFEEDRHHALFELAKHQHQQQSYQHLSDQRQQQNFEPPSSTAASSYLHQPQPHLQFSVQSLELDGSRQRQPQQQADAQRRERSGYSQQHSREHSGQGHGHLQYGHHHRQLPPPQRSFASQNNIMPPPQRSHMTGPITADWMGANHAGAAHYQQLHQQHHSGQELVQQGQVQNANYASTPVLGGLNLNLKRAWNAID